MIGLSVSLCIRQIIRGDVQERDVEKIIGSTACRTREDWEYVIRAYRETYWYENPELGESICCG